MPLKKQQQEESKSNKSSTVGSEVIKKKPKPHRSSKTEKEISQLKEDLKTEREKFIRLFAEFENYKKRTNRERLVLIETAGKDVITSFLPVLDDFERALQQLPEGDEDSLSKGVRLIYNKFSENLRSKGLKVIEVSQESEFDPEKHEAISQIASPKAKMKGKVIDVVEKGYTLGDKIIRYPKVVIAN